MARRFVSLLALMVALALPACSAVGVATTTIGVGVSAASTGVRVGIGATARAADLVIPDGERCERDDEDYPEEDEARCADEE